MTVTHSHTHIFFFFYQVKHGENLQLRKQTLLVKTRLANLLFCSKSWFTNIHQLPPSDSTSATSTRSVISTIDFDTNIEVLEKAKISSIEALLFKFQVHWTGHDSKMGNNHLCNHRHRRAQKNRPKDCLKKKALVHDILTVTVGPP